MSLSQMRVSDALDTAVEAVKDRTDHHGSLTSADVISIIDDICVDTVASLDGLPRELRSLREQAQGRQAHGDVGYRASDLCELLIMCGPWVSTI